MITLAGHLGRAAGILLWISALTPQVAMAVEAEKHADIQALMQETGMLANMNRTVELLMPQVINSLKKVNPNIPQATWDDFSRLGSEEFKKSLAELQEPVITIFDKNFTDGAPSIRPRSGRRW
jgi:hypothetical protein